MQSTKVTESSVGRPGVEAADLARLEEDILEVRTREVEEPEVAAADADTRPRRADQRNGTEAAARDVAVPPGRVGEIDGRAVDVGDDRLEDPRAAERRPVEAAAGEPAFEEAGVARILAGEVELDEVGRHIVAVGLQPIAAEPSELRQRRLAALSIRLWMV